MTASQTLLYPASLEPKTKVCNICGESLPINEFTRNKRYSDGRENRCKSCTISYYKELGKKHALAANLPIEKRCALCGLTKPMDEFYKAAWSVDGRHSRCKECHSLVAAERWEANPREPELNRKKNKDWRDGNKEYLKNYTKGKNYTYYGVTAEWYEAKFIEQNGKCELCGLPYEFSGKKRMSIDHNHVCCPTGRGCNKCRRGLLCTKCNTRLGVLEITDWVKQAKAYLKKYPLKDEKGNNQPSLFDGL